MATIHMSSYTPPAERYQACPMHRAPSACVAERKAMQSAAKTGKPSSYHWRMWHDPKAGQAKPLALGPIPRAWITRALTPAYKRPITWDDGFDCDYSEEQERRRQHRIEDHFAARARAAESDAA